MCGWAKLRFLWPILRFITLITFNENQNVLCGSDKLRFLFPIPFNHNQNPMCGWAKLRFLSPIPFNRNQNLVWLG